MVYGVCFARDRDLQLCSNRNCRFWRQYRGASVRVLLGSLTPFILERANPPKGGDAKLWAFGYRPPHSLPPLRHARRIGAASEGGTDGCQAAEGVGWRRARPSHRRRLSPFLIDASSRRAAEGSGENRRLSRSGDRLGGYTKACPALCALHTSVRNRITFHPAYPSPLGGF